LVATPTHFFLTYGQYHPRDWEAICTGLFTECHEGDLETMRLVVQRSPGPEQVIVVTTEAHGFNYHWDTEAGLVAPGDVEFDGSADFANAAGEVSALFDAAHSHVRIYVHEKGHGPIPCRGHENEPFGGYPGFGITGVRCSGAEGELGFKNGTGVVLTPGDVATPFDVALTDGRQVSYKLINMEATLWRWRSQLGAGAMWDEASSFLYEGARGDPDFAFDFAIGSRFDAEQFVNDSVSGSSPWKEIRGGSNRGDIFFDPITAWNVLVMFSSSLGTDYSYNPYVFAEDASL
jgi:hypothetical protein